MIEEENISESITAQIRSALKSDYEKKKEANKAFALNKSLHFNRNSACCHNRSTKLFEQNPNQTQTQTQTFSSLLPKNKSSASIKKTNKTTEANITKINNINNNRNNLNNSLLQIFNETEAAENLSSENSKLKKFLHSISNLQRTLNSVNSNQNLMGALRLEKSNNPNLKLNHVKFDQKPIDVDYNSSTDMIVITRDKQSKLRNAHYTDEEMKEREFKGDPFGNPFKRCKEDFEFFRNNNAIGVFDLAENFEAGFGFHSFNNLNKDKNVLHNQIIEEGEKNALLFQISSSVVQKNADDDLSVFPMRINRKRSRSAAPAAAASFRKKLCLGFLNKKSKLEEGEEEEEKDENRETRNEIVIDKDQKAQEIEGLFFFYFLLFNLF